MHIRHARSAAAHEYACAAAEAAAVDRQRFFCNIADVVQPNFTSLGLAQRNVSVGGKPIEITVHGKARRSA